MTGRHKENLVSKHLQGDGVDERREVAAEGSPSWGAHEAAYCVRGCSPHTGSLLSICIPFSWLGSLLLPRGGCQGHTLLERGRRRVSGRAAALGAFPW